MKKFTEEQLEAINAKSELIVVSASAGTGKTSVIVERVVQSLINGGSLKDFAIMTFTDAAAKEMKVRLESRLIDESRNHKNLIKEIKLLNECILCTIDSFCLNLVKKTRNNIKILNEYEENNIIETSINEILNTIYKDKKNNYIIDFFKNEENLIKSLKKWIFFSKNVENIDDFVKYSINNIQFSFEKSTMSKFLQDYIKKEIKFIIFLLKNIEYNSTNFNKTIKELEYICNIKSTFEIIKQINNFNLSLVNNNEFNNNKKIILNSVKEILDKLKYIPLQEYDESQKNIIIDFLHISKKISKKLLIYKQKNNIFSFSDLEKMALKRIKNVKKFTNKIKEIIIDEYQDINNIQNKIFESMSKNTFIVGDQKQSIYSFRNAQPDIMSFKKNKHKCVNINLTLNFRSHQNILNFVNKCFATIMTKKSNVIDYNDKNELKYSDNIKKHVNNDYKQVEFVFLNFNNKEKLDIESNFISKKIQEIIKKNIKIFDSNESRIINLSDFCIITRNYKKYSNYIFNSLKINKINFKSNNANNFLNCEEMKILNSYLEFIINPMQNIYFFNIISQIKYKLNIEEILNIKESSQNLGLYQSFKEKSKTSKKYKKILKNLENLRTIYKKNSLSKLIFVITNHLKKTHYYNNSNLDKIIYLLNEFIKEKEILTIENFTKYIKYEVKNTIFDDFDHKDAVLVTSIHKAKGKEFPICILMGCSTNFVNDNDKMHFNNAFGVILNDSDSPNPSTYSYATKLYLEEQKRSEEMRILYVALTRAKQKLIITATKPKRKNKLTELLKIIDSSEVREYMVRKSKSFYDLFSSVPDID